MNNNIDRKTQISGTPVSCRAILGGKAMERNLGTTYESRNRGTLLQTRNTFSGKGAEGIAMRAMPGIGFGDRLPDNDA
ncbi:MAG: hypothetical protein LBO79_09365 [Zoogloeaceae bacterium]|jgi:hypothetical protein|nr:hypothetical protein [Zoogloeaceae bacterium]